MSVLTKTEREIVFTVADDEKAWTIFCDSRRFGGKLRKLAARWGVQPVKTGHGFELTLPLKAIRFGGPRSPRPEGDSSRKSPSQTRLFGRRAKNPPVGPEATP